MMVILDLQRLSVQSVCHVHAMEVHVIQLLDSV